VHTVRRSTMHFVGLETTVKHIYTAATCYTKCHSGIGIYFTDLF